MTTERTALKPCPFCGDDEELRVCQPDHLSGYWVVHCGCCGGEMQAESKGGAIAGWNTRSLTPQAGEGVVEQVAKALCLSNGDDWNREGPGGLDSYRVQARAAIAAIPPAGRVEELERLRWLIRQYVDPFDVAPRDHALVLAIGTDDEAGYVAALGSHNG